MPSATWNLLNDVRKFIESEYADQRASLDGEWLARKARPIHDRLCTALANYSASLPADAAELVERLEEEGFLRAREKQELHGGDERWLNDRIQKDLCSRAASLIQSQAVRIAELERAASAALEDQRK